MVLRSSKRHASRVRVHEDKNVRSCACVGLSNLTFEIRSGLDVDPKGTHVLAAQTGGRAHLVNISQDDLKGKVQQVYASSDPELQGDLSYDFGALFINGGASLLFGCVRGCILAWDRAGGEVVYGLQHGEGTLRANISDVPRC